LVTTRKSLPALPIAVGIGVAGISSYAFLALAARSLGPARDAPLSALWASVFLVGHGCFLPVEQELARAVAARRAGGTGAGPVIRRAATVAGAGCGVLVITGVTLARPIADSLFAGQLLVLAGLLVGLSGYCVQHLACGALSGSGRFGRYGVVMGSEGLARLGGCVLLAAAGVRSPGPYALVVGAAPFVSVAVGLRAQRQLLQPGPDMPAGELAGALGQLLAGSVLSQLLLYAGPIAVTLLATRAERGAAAPFLAALVVARVPLFLFQAVQASLLPTLAGLVASGQVRRFRKMVARVLLAVGALAVLTTLGAIAVGPDVLVAVFGAGFRLDRGGLGRLAAGSGAYMAAIVLAQSLIALCSHRQAALGWAAGATVLVAVIALGSDLLARVEWALLLGSVAAAIAMGILVSIRLRRFGPQQRRIPASSRTPGSAGGSR